MKRSIKFLLLLILILPFPLYVNAPVQPYTIEGDKVYIDDENVYLSATPHTLSSSGWVEFELVSKKYEGEIDAVWGFNVSQAQPKKPQIWANYTHTLYRWVEANLTSEITFYNISGYKSLGIENYDLYEVDFGNRHNKWLYMVNGTLEMGEPETYIIAFSAYDPKPISMVESTLTYFYDGKVKESYESTFYDWKPWSVDVDKRLYAFRGMDTWYLMKNLEVEEGEYYRVRCWLQLPWTGLERSEGEYFFGVKPSHETLAEAKENGHLYVLDPWWNANWSYRKSLTFDNSASSENLANFPVLVHLNSTYIDWTHIQNSGQDIRFVDSDDSTELKYEIEKWDDTNDAWIWVKVPQIDLGSTTDSIYMYYGNTGATDNQDAVNVWDSNYVFVWHMTDNTTSSILDSTSNNIDGVKGGANEPIETTSGKIDSAQDFDGLDDRILHANYDFSSAYNGTIEMWFNRNDTSGEDHMFVYFKDWNNYLMWRTFNNKQYGTFKIGGVNLQLSSNTTYTNATWYYSVINNDGVNSTLWQNILCVDEKSDYWLDAIAGAGADIYLSNPNSGRYMGGILDEIRVSSPYRSFDWIEASYLTQTEAYITFGSLETPPTGGIGPGGSYSEPQLPPTPTIVTDQIVTDAKDYAWLWPVLAVGLTVSGLYLYENQQVKHKLKRKVIKQRNDLAKSIGLKREKTIKKKPKKSRFPFKKRKGWTEDKRKEQIEEINKKREKREKKTNKEKSMLKGKRKMEKMQKKIKKKKEKLFGR